MSGLLFKMPRGVDRYALKTIVIPFYRSVAMEVLGSSDKKLREATSPVTGCRMMISSILHYRDGIPWVDRDTRSSFWVRCERDVIPEEYGVDGRYVDGHGIGKKIEIIYTYSQDKFDIKITADTLTPMRDGQEKIMKGLTPLQTQWHLNRINDQFGYLKLPHPPLDIKETGLYPTPHGPF